ncbi:hypothetical protein BU14_0129s0006 [Porphyra umbilicalis]|uniref:Uncharacterized protein n=1 Tax=Porphyra umbilicalis TaxID=2786 RepID=A0A1X6PAW0_PORUM|nr:hypothetical protein BU14_0129s0006 [Porphyra umbilicalis]|eukprot:OSX77890.1 hypothetical protein BU14_0129s0006 [Porphyra umbilicalis]
MAPCSPPDARGPAAAAGGGRGAARRGVSPLNWMDNTQPNGRRGGGGGGCLGMHPAVMERSEKWWGGQNDKRRDAACPMAGAATGAAAAVSMPTMAAVAETSAAAAVAAAAATAAADHPVAPRLVDAPWAGATATPAAARSRPCLPLGRTHRVGAPCNHRRARRQRRRWGARGGRRGHPRLWRASGRVKCAPPPPPLRSAAPPLLVLVLLPPSALDLLRLTPAAAAERGCPRVAVPRCHGDALLPMGGGGQGEVGSPDAPTHRCRNPSRRPPSADPEERQSSRRRGRAAANRPREKRTRSRGGGGGGSAFTRRSGSRPARPAAAVGSAPPRQRLLGAVVDGSRAASRAAPTGRVAPRPPSCNAHRGGVGRHKQAPPPPPAHLQNTPTEVDGWRCSGAVKGGPRNTRASPANGTGQARPRPAAPPAKDTHRDTRWTKRMSVARPHADAPSWSRARAHAPTLVPNRPPSPAIPPTRPRPQAHTPSRPPHQPVAPPPRRPTATRQWRIPPPPPPLWPPPPLRAGASYPPRAPPPPSRKRRHASPDAVAATRTDAPPSLPTAAAGAAAATPSDRSAVAAATTDGGASRREAARCSRGAAAAAAVAAADGRSAKAHAVGAADKGVDGRGGGCRQRRGHGRPLVHEHVLSGARHGRPRGVDVVAAGGGCDRHGRRGVGGRQGGQRLPVKGVHRQGVGHRGRRLWGDRHTAAPRGNTHQQPRGGQNPQATSGQRGCQNRDTRQRAAPQMDGMPAVGRPRGCPSARPDGRRELQPSLPHAAHPTPPHGTARTRGRPPRGRTPAPAAQPQHAGEHRHPPQPALSAPTTRTCEADAARPGRRRFSPLPPGGSARPPSSPPPPPPRWRNTSSTCTRSVDTVGPVAASAAATSAGRATVGETRAGRSSQPGGGGGASAAAAGRRPLTARSSTATAGVAAGACAGAGAPPPPSPPPSTRRHLARPGRPPVAAVTAAAADAPSRPPASTDAKRVAIAASSGRASGASAVSETIRSEARRMVATAAAVVVTVAAAPPTPPPVATSSPSAPAAATAAATAAAAAGDGAASRTAAATSSTNSTAGAPRPFNPLRALPGKTRARQRSDKATSDRSAARRPSALGDVATNVASAGARRVSAAATAAASAPGATADANASTAPPTVVGARRRLGSDARAGGGRECRRGFDADPGGGWRRPIDGCRGSHRGGHDGRVEGPPQRRAGGSGERVGGGAVGGGGGGRRPRRGDNGVCGGAGGDDVGEEGDWRSGERRSHGYKERRYSSRGQGQCAQPWQPKRPHDAPSSTLNIHNIVKVAPISGSHISFLCPDWVPVLNQGQGIADLQKMAVAEWLQSFNSVRGPMETLGIMVVSVWFGLPNMNGIQPDSLERWSVQVERNMSKGILVRRNTYNGDGGTKQKGPNTDMCRRGVEAEWMPRCPRSSLLHSTQSWGVSQRGSQSCRTAPNHLADQFEVVNESSCLPGQLVINISKSFVVWFGSFLEINLIRRTICRFNMNLQPCLQDTLISLQDYWRQLSANSTIVACRTANPTSFLCCVVGSACLLSATAISWRLVILQSFSNAVHPLWRSYTQNVAHIFRAEDDDREPRSPLIVP